MSTQQGFLVHNLKKKQKSPPREYHHCHETKGAETREIYQTKGRKEKKNLCIYIVFLFSFELLFLCKSKLSCSKCQKKSYMNGIHQRAVALFSLHVYYTGICIVELHDVLSILPRGEENQQGKVPVNRI